MNSYTLLTHHSHNPSGNNSSLQHSQGIPKPPSKMPWSFSRRYPENPPEYADEKEYDYTIIGGLFSPSSSLLSHLPNPIHSPQAEPPAAFSPPSSASRQPTKSSSSNAVPQMIPFSHGSYFFPLTFTLPLPAPNLGFALL